MELLRHYNTERRLDEATAESIMIDCIQRLHKGSFDAFSLSLVRQLMKNDWGYTHTIQTKIDGFQGSAVDSLFLRGYQLYSGYGVDNDRDAALKLAQEGVELGDLSGRCHTLVGLCLYHRDLGAAIELLHEGHKRSCPLAMAVLAACFVLGRGVKADAKKAASLYMEAHIQGFTTTHNLGEKYYNGKGVPENKLLGVALYIDAADMGWSRSVKRLAEWKARDPSSVVPYSYWRPLRHVHKWVTAQIDLEMVCLLIAKSRNDGLINLLPHEIILMICFHLCCEPECKRSTESEPAESLDLVQQEVSNVIQRISNLNEEHVGDDGSNKRLKSDD